MSEEWERALEKKLKARIDTLLNDPVLLKIYERFGGEVFRRSSVFHGLDAFLRQAGVRGKVCFEIGTWNGITAAVLSRYFDRVETCDIVDNPIKYKVFDALGIKNVRCHRTGTNEEKARLARKLQFDFAYMDGDHHNDTEFDFDLVRRCQRVLFQECWDFQTPVWELVNALPQEQILKGGDGFALWDATRTP